MCLENGTDIKNWPYFHGGSIYNKRNIGCGCRKRKHGQPKVWEGMCKCDNEIRKGRYRKQQQAIEDEFLAA